MADLSGKDGFMLTIVLIVLLVLWLGGSFPRAGSYNANWGYAPVGLGTILIIVLLVMVLDGRI
jgi:hypothetical protein